MRTTATERSVGRKKTPRDKPSRYGTQIRVSDAAADIITKAAGAEGLSVAVFVDKHLVSIADRRYRDAIMREAKRLGGGE